MIIRNTKLISGPEEHESVRGNVGYSTLINKNSMLNF